MDRRKRRTRRQRLKFDWRRDPLVTGLTVALILAAVVTAGLAFKFVREVTATWNFTPLDGIALQPGGGDAGGSGGGGAAGNQPPIDTSVLQVEPWDGTSRVTVLLLGLDARDWEVGNGPPRSDTMILFTIDPVSKTAGMLSIPRDLWVNVPGFGYGRINTAYQNGEGARLPGGGPGLAMLTVEEFLGIKVDYYAQVDFGTFVDFIDLIGGVQLDVKEPIEVWKLGNPHPTKIKPGVATYTGDLVLAYARTRKTAGADFDRAQRQQEVILAIRDRLLEPEAQQRVLQNAPQIWATLSGGIHTNLTFEEILQLAFLAKDVNINDIARGAIAPPEYVTLDKSPDGADVLKPITAKIRELRDEIFTSSALVAPGAVGASSAELMQTEAATVGIYNGTLTAGLAGATQIYLQGLGVNVVEAGNGDLVEYTTIYVYTSKPYTLQFLVDEMNIQPTRIFYANEPSSLVDVAVVLGNDWFVPTP